MKESKQNAQRWLREAEKTWQQAQRAGGQKDYNLACFLAEQSAQKSLKAVLYGDGVRFINIHSVAELLKLISQTHPEFSQLSELGVKLDQYYLTTRYPDAVPDPAIPSEIFIKDQADEALFISEKILILSRSLIALS